MMPKAREAVFEFHFERRTMSRDERRAAIRKGYEDYQAHGWLKDPCYPENDPRRWLWQDGAETAERVHQGRAHGIEETARWMA